ncbi:MAG: thiamine pyrophosphate-binding protein [Pseudomonadota bacterium]
MLVADDIADALISIGVRHVFGVGGANIEDLFAAVQRRRPQLRAVLTKHEHAAGAAADAYARLTGSVGVVLTTSGGGAMNIVHALAEARASRVPLLAVVGEPPRELQGVGAFQDTSGRNGAIDAAAVFGPVSVFCRRVTGIDDVRPTFEAALAAARGRIPGPAVLLLSKDLQSAESQPRPVRAAPEDTSMKRVDETGLARALRIMRSGPIVVIAGDQVARRGAADDLARLVDRLDASVCVTPDGRDAFDNLDPRFLGVSGAMGHGAVATALDGAAACLLVGTRLPVLARMGLEKLLRERPLVALAGEAPFFSSSSPECIHLDGDLRTNLERLAAALPDSRPAGKLRAHAADRPAQTTETWSASQVASAVGRSLDANSVVVADAGNTGAEAVHHINLPRGGRWLLAMGMAGMGWSFGAAVGAACATARRCTVLAGDGAFFMHGLEVHTAIEHALPITFVVFNNRAHGMCLVRERLLLGRESGYNSFGVAHIGAGLAAMFPGLPAWDCSSLAALEAALGRARETQGPALIVAELPAVDVPPFLAFRASGGSR